MGPKELTLAFTRLPEFKCFETAQRHRCFRKANVSIENHLVLPTPSSTIVDPHTATAHPRPLTLAPNPESY
jgi:hypothetical protein